MSDWTMYLFCAGRSCRAVESRTARPDVGREIGRIAKVSRRTLGTFGYVHQTKRRAKFKRENLLLALYIFHILRVDVAFKVQLLQKLFKKNYFIIPKLVESNNIFGWDWANLSECVICSLGCHTRQCYPFSYNGVAFSVH